jgi:hypothetical protein
MQSTMHIYEVRPRKDKRGVDLISNVLPQTLAPISRRQTRSRDVEDTLRASR